jgi:CheY-like chemotaxis protein
VSKPRFSQPPVFASPKVLERIGNARLPRIVHVDDEAWFGELAEEIIRSTFQEITLLRFQNSGLAYQELLKCEPDLLITDLNNGYLPGTGQVSPDGWQMLPLLAQRKVTYPILVVSGGFLMSGMESRARKLAGPDLNISFITKPFPIEFFKSELLRLLILKRHSGRRFP